MFNYGALWTPKSHRILTVYTTNIIPISSIFITFKQKILKVTQVELKMNWLMKKDVILQLQMKNVATWARSRKSKKTHNKQKTQVYFYRWVTSVTMHHTMKPRCPDPCPLCPEHVSQWDFYCSDNCLFYSKKTIHP